MQNFIEKLKAIIEQQGVYEQSFNIPHPQGYCHEFAINLMLNLNTQHPRIHCYVAESADVEYPCHTYLITRDDSEES